MDRWKFYAVTHRDHVIMNPLSSEALDEVLNLASIPANARVLDIGCGKAELLIRLARLGAKTAIGVELSPYTAREGRERVRSLAPKANITIVEEDGATFASGLQLTDGDCGSHMSAQSANRTSELSSSPRGRPYVPRLRIRRRSDQ